MRICSEKRLLWWNLGGNSGNREGKHHIIISSWKLHHLLIYSKAWCHMDVGRYKGSHPHIINKYANSQPASQAVYEFYRLLFTSRGGSPGLSLSVCLWSWQPGKKFGKKNEQGLVNVRSQIYDVRDRTMRRAGGKRDCLFCCFEVCSRAICQIGLFLRPCETAADGQINSCPYKVPRRRKVM